MEETILIIFMLFHEGFMVCWAGGVVYATMKAMYHLDLVPVYYLSWLGYIPYAMMTTVVLVVEGMRIYHGRQAA